MTKYDNNWIVQNHWIPHPTKVDSNHVGSDYTVIKESADCVEAIKHKTCVAVRFTIWEKYQEDLDVLTSFIKEWYNQIVNKGYQSVSIQEAENELVNI